VRFPRLGINVEVVPSKFVYVGQGGNWQVPAFKVGHAEYTGGAGQVGNAVLLGHVSSRGLGNVFQNLERARVGDILEITGRSGAFSYQVVDVLRVPRTEVSVVQPTAVPAVSLITCTGAWLATLQDYAERVVVRGELVQGG
jgi:LPXTG-site transpeptidase (sortase) family protein